MNKIYKPINFFSRLFYKCSLNHQILQNARQRVYPERILLDMRQIETIWRRTKDSKVLSKYLYNCCIQTSELMNYTIDMIHFACNRNSSTQTLVWHMIQAFGNYIDENKPLVSPSLEQKVDVLSSVLNFKNYEVVQLVCRVFKFHEEPFTFKLFIKSLINEHKFFEAAYAVSALHLQNEFDIEEILVPLLLEGNVHVATTYLSNHPDLQLKVVKFLDGYLDVNKPVDPDSYIKPKKIFRTLSSLLTIFRIPLGNCPNSQFIRSKGAINILIKRRYGQSINEATWEEMIKNIVQDNEDLKKHVIKKLIINRDKKTAEKMAEIFKINISDMSFKIPEVSDAKLENSNENENFEVHDISDEYLNFTLKTEDIIVVNNKEDFNNCIDDLCQNYRMIGIDSEWKPHFGLSRDKLSLIQLAVHDKVYVLDLLTLFECLDAEHWDRLLDDVFGNPKLIKLGCGIMSDVHMILESIKGTKGKAVKFSHMLDMALFYEKLRDIYPMEMHNYSDKIFTRGLSSLCDIILGKPLNKEDRLCDWEKRPLLEKQLEYAALDAHCLLLMFDKLREDSKEKGMNFDHIVKVAIVLTTSQWKPKRKYKGVKSGKEIHVQSSVPVEQLKIVMTSEFEKHGKELRKVGADVIILQGPDAVDEAIELSKREGRILVCSEDLYIQTKEKVREGFCYYFRSTEDNMLQVSTFLQHFNAQLSTKSIYSRCLSCNSNDGIKLSSEDLKILYELKKSCDTSMNNVLEENLSYLSSELQTDLKDILNSNIKINFANQNNPYSANEYAFLCKCCGSIS